jgi:hypothetical protein
MRLPLGLAIWAVCAAAAACAGQTRPTTATAARANPIYVDAHATLRWAGDHREVALFGVNYCLPSASDYRAAGYFTSDRKKVIEQDMAHLARMGFDGLRLSFWGDYENSDERGNLVANDHLDLLDYLIAQAGARHISMLLSPIVTYDANWPDGKDIGGPRGISQHFKKSELGTNPDAIAAQQNYLRQLLNHVNPYTGLALRDDPAIPMIEMINEPWHHPDDRAGSVRYINALVDAVRSTGCRKVTFHNVSQAFNMARPIMDSEVEGSSFAWYPSGLNSGHQLRGNFLRYLDAYPPMLDPTLAPKPRVVYEFDLPDVISGYHYPAMARTFRQVGAQFAAMFSYDMLASASHNMGWTTHVLNLVYTPKKAVSAIIAGEVMHRLPRFETYGPYPQNRTFGDFRVSYEEDLAECVTPTTFMYSNNTATVPPDPAKLEKIVGFGSSPVVKYDGLGAYFVERVAPGCWRLEVYPDALQVADPFHAPSQTELKFRIIRRSHRLTLHLPDLGDTIDIRSPNPETNESDRTSNGAFSVSPGVYVLLSAGTSMPTLPQRWGNVAFAEFICPPDEQAPRTLSIQAPTQHLASQPIRITATVADHAPPASVTLWTRQPPAAPTSRPMLSSGPYDYIAEVAALSPGKLEYAVTLDNGTPTEWHPTQLLSDSDPLTLLDVTTNLASFETARHGWSPVTVTPTALLLHFAAAPRRAGDPADVPRQTPSSLARNFFIGDLLAGRGGQAVPKSVLIKSRCTVPGSTLKLTFVETTGAAWSTTLTPTPDASELNIPLTTFTSTPWSLLPLAYPGELSPTAAPTPGPQHPERFERLQLTVTPSQPVSAADGIEIVNIALKY